MRPILIKFWDFNIYGYGTLISIGICAALLLVSLRAKKRGYDEDNIINMSIIAIIFGILGGKLLYIIVELKAIIEEPALLLDLGSGFVIYGAIIGGAFGIYLYCKRKKWDLLKIYDLVSPAIVLGQGFGRIGCFLAGCCYGKKTNLIIGVRFPRSSIAPSDLELHPTQLYSSIFDFLLAIFLLWYSRKERQKGRVFSMYIIIYSIGRFFLEFLRDDPRGSIGMLSTSQLISFFGIVLGAFIFNMEKIRAFKKAEGEEELQEDMGEKFIECNKENLGTVTTYLNGETKVTVDTHLNQ